MSNPYGYVSLLIGDDQDETVNESVSLACYCHCACACHVTG